MVKYRTALPQINGGTFLHYVGMETDLIFNRGMDLPGFASYPLLETDTGRSTLRDYYIQLVMIAREMGVAVILDSVTWVANRERGAAICYSPEKLRELNIAAIELIAQIREEYDDLTLVLCAQMGPRSDGYVPENLMSAEEAEDYHSEQMETLSQTKADMVAGFTLCYPEEAIGIVRAGQRFKMPVAISFTVETDGCLPTGISLRDAIQAVDAATNSGAVYFLVNCAHPDHISQGLENEPWIKRVQGIVANASRCSHAELDESEELDDGNPEELGKLSADLRRKFPHFTIFGGCCGTDMRHMTFIAKQTKTALADQYAPAREA